MNELRQPRSIVKVNGGNMDFISWETNNNGFYQADTFTVKFPLYTSQVAWWSQQPSLDTIIYDGITATDQSKRTLRIQGFADSIELDPIQRIVRVTGRDYTSKLIDTKVAPPNPNYRAYEVAIAYAEKYGLEHSVKPTKSKIGTYYSIDHVKMTVEKSAWDILCYLAHQEQFIVYVSGQTLHFEPLPGESAARVLTLDNSQRITTGPAPSLQFIRNLTLAHGIVVYVRSWNHKSPKGFTVVARSKRTKDPVTKKNQPLTGQEQVYSYTIPNLDRDAAQQKANAYLAAISKHEVRFDANDIPGDATLNPFQPVKWNFHGTQYEQTYFLDSIIRRYDFETGYTMSLRGKNHSVDSAVLL